ncbi:suppressor of Cytokine Signaling at 44A [Leptinotarsa decemlineata]|uniref:suppressor of Cytokine Signaling at 44A n=1 Tax=Leptinotarsa decemlineata TaxID=7539 RepID=UPI003D30A870
MSNSNNNKTKNWLSRLMRIPRRSLENLENSNDQERPIVYRRGVSVYNGDSSSHQPRTLNSFRRSIMKMHTRMKNAFRHNNSNSNTTRHTLPILPITNNLASPSHSQIRITLGSPAKHSENIYSLEPTKKVSTSPQLGNSIPRVSSRTNSVLQEESIDPAPLIPPRRRYYPQLTADDQSSRVPKNEIANLSNFYWYWGPISRSQAEERLKSSPDGAFLVRDSTSDRYLFTMSFRSLGKILHTRIEFSKSGYSLFDQIGYNSVSELVEDAIVRSQNSVYCYTRYDRDEVRPNFPVRLTLPVSRYDKVPTLKYLSRFIIRQSVIINDMDKLPLPVSLIAYLQEEGPYF